MNVLKEYARMCQQFQIRHDELVFILGGDNTKLFHFFDGVRKGAFTDDESAAEYLYKKNAQHGAYKQLKSDLKKRLVDIMLTVDFQSSTQLTGLQKAMLKCTKNWSVIQMLAGRDMTNATIELALNTLPLALEYELTEVAFNCARMLTMMFELRRSKDPRLQTFRATMNKQHSILMAEYQSNKYYVEVIQFATQSRALQLDVHEKAMFYYNEIQPFLEQFDSFRLHLTGRLIQIHGFGASHQFEEGLKVCDAAIVFFEQKTFETNTQIGIFLNQKTACCLNLKKYDLGLETLLRAKSLLEVGTYNWFNTSILHVKILLHKGGYRDSWVNFTMLKKQPSLAKQAKTTHEDLNILEAYLNYLIHFKEIELTKEEMKEVKKFRISRFLNEVPTYSKDKRGAYISVLVVQIMWTLIDASTRETLVERLDALEKYRSRYVRNNENPRTHLFISLVKELVRSDYNVNRIKQSKRAPQILEKMSHLPVELNPTGQTAEVMPYEAIWKFMLRSITHPVPLGDKLAA